MAPPKCVYRNCPTFFTTENRRHFKLPKDRQRSEMWLRAIGRTDLLGPHKVYNRLYKVCDLHFTDDMYMNPNEKGTLLNLAFPTPFKYLSTNELSSSNSTIQSSPDDHTYSKPSEERVNTELISSSTDNLDSSQDSLLQSIIKPEPETFFTPLYFQVEGMKEDNASTSHQSPTQTTTEKLEQHKPKPAPIVKKTVHQLLLPPSTKSHVETQTNKKYLSTVPDHVELKRIVKNLKEDVKNLTSKIAKLKNEIQQRPTSYMEFDRMCDQMLSANFSKVVKLQARLSQAVSGNGLRFGPDHMQFSMAIYNACGPQGYKHLQETFILPSKRSLERFANANRSDKMKTATTE